eukprot:5133543-Pleurochrysis_carterae.AAC.1
MRALLRGARDLTSQWLAVAVPREANGDADRLSHPAQLPDVERDARSAGLRVHLARIPECCWAALRAASAEDDGGEGALSHRRRQ